MVVLTWTVFGLFLGAAVLIVSMLIDPDFRGRFSLPILPFGMVLVLHLFFYFRPMMWACLILDVVILMASIIYRIKR
jgi:hypothetical protein